MASARAEKSVSFASGQHCVRLRTLKNVTFFCRSDFSAFYCFAHMSYTLRKDT